MKDDSKLSDAELLALVSAGNADAEEALAERYSRLVRICARPLFLIGGDSEDLPRQHPLRRITDPGVHLSGSKLSCY